MNFERTTPPNQHLEEIYYPLNLVPRIISIG